MAGAVPAIFFLLWISLLKEGAMSILDIWAIYIAATPE
jgi:hypothetical protein